MKLTYALFALAVALFAAAYARAQGTPPPMAPDYFPEKWKKFDYEIDNVRARFPVEPDATTSTSNESFGPVTTRKYERKSFITLCLTAIEYPAKIDLEGSKPGAGLLQKLQDGALGGISGLVPQTASSSDVTVDGHAARIVRAETADGRVVRFKIFVVRNRLYYAFTEVKKGERHGVNYENDFEKIAAAFLDSVRLIDPRK